VAYATARLIKATGNGQSSRSSERGYPPAMLHRRADLARVPREMFSTVPSRFRRSRAAQPPINAWFPASRPSGEHLRGLLYPPRGSTSPSRKKALAGRSRRSRSPRGMRRRSSPAAWSTCILRFEFLGRRPRHDRLSSTPVGVGSDVSVCRDSFMRVHGRIRLVEILSRGSWGGPSEPRCSRAHVVTMRGSPARRPGPARTMRKQHRVCTTVAVDGESRVPSQRLGSFRYGYLVDRLLCVSAGPGSVLSWLMKPRLDHKVVLPSSSMLGKTLERPPRTGCAAPGARAACAQAEVGVPPAPKRLVLCCATHVEVVGCLVSAELVAVGGDVPHHTTRSPSFILAPPPARCPFVAVRPEVGERRGNMRKDSSTVPGTSSGSSSTS